MTGENTRPEVTATGSKRYTKTEIASIIVLIAGIIWTITLFVDFGRTVKTNNAQIDCELIAVTSRITGIISSIRFDAYDNIKSGDTLVLIDDDEFRIKYEQAEADLEAAKANLVVLLQTVETSRSQEAASVARLQGNTASLERAEKNYKRYENMFADSAVTRNQFDQVIAQWKTDQAYLEAGEKEVLASKSTRMQNEKNVLSAKASVKRREADLEAAALQLSYTVITAPSDGIAGEKTIYSGELLNANQLVLNLVSPDRKWVMANFKETQVDKIKPGQEAVISIDALGGRKFPGRVRNLSPATGAKFSMVAPDNSTGNFVKITQRVPVIIDFTMDGNELLEVKPGMNVSVQLKK